MAKSAKPTPVNDTPETTDVAECVSLKTVRNESDASVGGAISVRPPSTAISGLEDVGRKTYTNWDITTPADARRLMRAVASPDKDSASLINTVFPIRHFLVHWIEIANKETGEVSEYPRVVLITPDGTTAGFVSVGVYESLKWLYRLFGPGPYIPAIPAIVKQEELGQGKRLLRLDLADDAELPPLQYFTAK